MNRSYSQTCPSVRQIISFVLATQRVQMCEVLPHASSQSPAVVPGAVPLLLRPGPGVPGLPGGQIAPRPDASHLTGQRCPSRTSWMSWTSGSCLLTTCIQFWLSLPCLTPKTPSAIKDRGKKKKTNQKAPPDDL